MTYDSPFASGGAVSYKKFTEVAVPLGTPYDGSRNLLQAWFDSNKAGDILIGASNAMNASGQISTMTLAYTRWSDGVRRTAGTGGVGGSGTAVGFKITSITEIEGRPNRYRGQLYRFNSGNPNRGWNFSTPGASAGNSLLRLIDAAEAASVFVDTIQVEYSMPVSVSMQTFNSSVGAQGTFGILVNGRPADAPTPAATPKPSSGQLVASKNYQRGDADISLFAFVASSSQLRMYNGSGYSAVSPATPLAADARIPSAAGTWNRYDVSTATYLPVNAKSTFALEARGRNNAGALQSFTAVDFEPVTIYAPLVTTFAVTTPDALARASGIHRTRTDVPFEFNLETANFDVRGGDPGDQSVSVLLTRSTGTPAVAALSDAGAVIGTFASTAAAVADANVSSGMYDANGIAQGFLVNRKNSFSVLPESSFDGFLASNITMNATLNLGLRAVRSSGATSQTTLTLSTSKLWPGAPAPAVQIVPLATGTAQFGSVGTVGFTQPSRNRPEAAAGFVTSDLTLTSANVTLTVSIQNHYPGSYTALMIAPAEISTPLSAVGLLASNYPTGNSTITVDLSGYLHQKPLTRYHLSILNYNPVDAQSLLAASGDLRLPAAGVTFGDAAVPTSGDALWTPPGSATAFRYGWSRLAVIPFSYCGPLALTNVGLVTEQ